MWLKDFFLYITDLVEEEKEGKGQTRAGTETSDTISVGTNFTSTIAEARPTATESGLGFHPLSSNGYYKPNYVFH